MARLSRSEVIPSEEQILGRLLAPSEKPLAAGNLARFATWHDFEVICVRGKPWSSLGASGFVTAGSGWK